MLSSNMKDIYNPIYRQEYLEGYSNGLDPYATINGQFNSEAFNFGFHSGRQEYESMNGRILDGIPFKIVTKRVLEDFLLAGMLGLSVDTDNYTTNQLNVLAKWYQSGIEKYDPNESTYLFSVLAKNGIEVSEKFYL